MLARLVFFALLLMPLQAGAASIRFDFCCSSEIVQAFYEEDPSPAPYDFRYKLGGPDADPPADPNSESQALLSTVLPSFSAWRVRGVWTYETSDPAGPRADQFNLLYSGLRDVVREPLSSRAPSAPAVQSGLFDAIVAPQGALVFYIDAFPAGGGRAVATVAGTVTATIPLPPAALLLSSGLGAVGLFGRLARRARL